MPPTATAGPVQHPGSNRLRLKPALRALWRDRQTLQLGLSPGRAVVLSGLSPAHARLLELLDGSTDADELTAAAAALGISAADVDGFVAALASAGALEDGTVPAPALDERARQLLEPDRLSLSLLHPGPGAADTVLTRRRNAGVTVHGAGRIGATLAALVGAAGVGRIACVDDGGLRVSDLSPGGVAQMRGGTRADAAAASVAAVTPALAVSTAPDPDSDVVVVAPAGCVAAPEVFTGLRGVPHLLVAVRETTAMVGPFVLPGATPCLRCVEIGRGERDPHWPLLAAQLASSRRGVDPCDAALAALAASLAAVQVLWWLDRRTPPPSASGILELDLADAVLRRRSVVAHPACGCGAAG